MKLELSHNEFLALTEFIHNKCGIVVNKDKEYLIHQRVAPLVERNGFSSFEEYTKKLSSLFHSHLLDELIEVMTTNETSFFRDKHPFDTFYNKILPELVKNRKMGRKIRIWSAASSSGQEIYSIAMLIFEFIENNKGLGLVMQNFELVATDISNEMLNKVKTGSYNGVEIKRGLSPARLNNFFTEKNEMWYAKKELTQIITTKHINLTSPYSSMGLFDLILCRNVLIYFDEKTKNDIVTQMYYSLNKTGYLMLGAMETLNTTNDLFVTKRIDRTTICQPKPSNSR